MYGSLVSSPNGRASIQQSNSSNIVDQEEFDKIKREINELYQKIQSLNSKQSELLAKHKSKYLKCAQTEFMLSREQRENDEQLKAIQLQADIEVKKNEKERNSLTSQVLQIEQENSQILELISEVNSQIQSIITLIETAESQWNHENGGLLSQKKQNKQSKQQVKELGEEIQDLENNKSKLEEQNEMTLNDALSHEIRLADFKDLLEWKHTKIEQKRQKIKNPKSKLYNQIVIEQQSLDEWQKYVDTLQKIVVPSLLCNSQIISGVISDINMQILGSLNQKDKLLKQINENQSNFTNNQKQDEQEIKLSILGVRKEYLINRQIELQEKQKTNQNKIKEIHDTMTKQQENLQVFVQQISIKIQNLDQRSHQIRQYKEQIQKVVKPSILKLDSRIKDFDQQNEVLRSKLIRLQKKLNQHSVIKDYQYLSNSVNQVSALDIYKNFTDEELRQSCGPSNFDYNTIQTSKPAEPDNDTISLEDYVQTPQAIVEPTILEVLSDKTNHSSQRNSLDPISDKPSLSQCAFSRCQTADPFIIAYNSKDPLFRLMPLLTSKGIEVYKKSFDTKLLNLNHQHRYNILSCDQDPIHLGYHLRYVAIDSDSPNDLIFINPQDDLGRAEVKIRMRKAKVQIGKDTLEALKVQKEAKEPLSQLSNYSSNSSMLSPQKAKNARQQSELEDYKSKCLRSKYYSLQILFGDRDYDILVSSQTGSFHFEVLRRAVQTMVEHKIGPAEKDRLKAEMKRRQ